MNFTELKRTAKKKALNAYCWVENHKTHIKYGAIVVGSAIVGGYLGRDKGRKEGFDAGRKFQLDVDEMYLDHHMDKGLIVENYDHDSLEAKDAFYEALDASNAEVENYIQNHMNQKKR